MAKTLDLGSKILYFLTPKEAQEKQTFSAGELPMKHVLRVIALTFVFAAGVTGYTPAKATLVASNLPSMGVPGPTPTCNPFIQQCPPIR